MQERQVTIGDTSYRLPEPFVVIATQNPIEHEGTYALPEAQIDRFVMKLRVDSPTADEEMRILEIYLDPTAQPVAIRRILTIAEIAQIAHLAASVHADQRISGCSIQLVAATRTPLAL